MIVRIRNRRWPTPRNEERVRIVCDAVQRVAPGIETRVVMGTTEDGLRCVALLGTAETERIKTRLMVGGYPTAFVPRWALVHATAPDPDDA